MRHRNTTRRFTQKWLRPIAPLLAGMTIFYIADGGPEYSATTATLPSTADTVVQVDTTTADTTTTDSVETAVVEEPAGRFLATGEASYYGPGFAGRPTANGETFNPAKLTAAHRTLPFGTMLRVTNQTNGESVVVRVNDRGPYAGHRILDLSEGAARQIGMVSSGTATVRIEVLA